MPLSGKEKEALKLLTTMDFYAVVLLLFILRTQPEREAKVAAAFINEIFSDVEAL